MRMMKKLKAKKSFRTLASLFLLAVLVFGCMPQTVLAAGETYSITINNSVAGHTYTAYQIFTGDYSNGTLSNIEWGSGITDDGKKGLTGQNNVANAIASEYAKNLDDSDAARELAEALVGNNKYLKTTGNITDNDVSGGYILTGLTAGYYLITDESTSGVVSAYIVKVVGADATVNPKTGIPEFEKKVQDINDSGTTSTLSGLQDTADYDIGDDVPFTLTITLPENYESFQTYYLAITDSMSEGLSLNKNSFKITYNSIGEDTDADDDEDPDVTSTLIADTSGTYKNIAVDTTDHATDNKEYVLLTSTTSYDDDSDVDAEVRDFKLAIENLKEVDALASAKAGDTITITYTATLTERADIGNDGNTNTANLTYQSNPNYEGSIIPGKPGEDDKTDSDGDGTPDDDDDDSDNDGTPDESDDDDDDDGIKDDDDTDDDGDGIPDDEEDDKADDVVDKTGDDKVVVFTYELLIDKIKGAEETEPYDALKGATFSLYKKGGSGTSTWSTDTTYKLVETIAGTNTSTFTFKGLDDGDYVLVEDNAPAGYNKIEPIYFTIKAEHVANETKETPTLQVTSLTISATANTTTTAADVASFKTYEANGGSITKMDNSTATINSGDIYTEIVNNAGATLPSTGGIGTTMFYIIGGICVVGAGVLLITKRVMSKKTID